MTLFSSEGGASMRTKTVACLGLVVLLTSAFAAAGRRSAPPMAGTVSGTVTFTGTPPKMKPIDMAKEPSCAAQHSTPAETQTVVTGPNSSLQYVVVYVSAGDQAATAPTTPVRFDQKGCTYIPHVLAMIANQPLEIANNDQTSHNIHPIPTKNPEWNKSQPPGSPPIETKYATPEFIPVKCNIHPWMHGYFAVLNTSHYAVTGEDGTFSLAGLPPGKYTITAWQEHMGTQTQDVTITGSETQKVNFVFKATPY
jgi:Carboxypeptidase regulatory-like domain